MIPRDCPKFESCSAPLCPLNKSAGSHLTGEPICAHLRELVKTGGRGRLLNYIPEQMVNLIAEGMPEIISRYADIKFRLERASATGSKMETFRPKRRQAA